jgi:hypothetical protein
LAGARRRRAGQYSVPLRHPVPTLRLQIDPARPLRIANPQLNSSRRSNPYPSSCKPPHGSSARCPGAPRGAMARAIYNLVNTETRSIGLWARRNPRQGIETTNRSSPTPSAHGGADDTRPLVSCFAPQRFGQPSSGLPFNLPGVACQRNPRGRRTASPLCNVHMCNRDTIL